VAARIEDRVATISDPADRIDTHLSSVGEEMRKMSQACHGDTVSPDGTFEVWAPNARASAQRVREFISDGVAAGHFHGVHAEFAGETYRELSGLVLAALTSTSSRGPSACTALGPHRVQIRTTEGQRERAGRKCR
jgi:hypothetical protein